jgi:hypothetical protein
VDPSNALDVGRYGGSTLWPHDPTPLRVPTGAVWLAAAARTCRAWLEPARRLHHTLHIHTTRVPAEIVERIGHRVRTLVIHIGPTIEPIQPNIPFDRFTGLTTLAVVNQMSWRVCNMETLINDLLRSCPSFPNLTNLILWFPSWPLMVDFVERCENLRRLQITDAEFDDSPFSLDSSSFLWNAEDESDDSNASTSESENSEGESDGSETSESAVAPPEKLEELVIVRGHAGSTLAPLYAAPGLVTLNIVEPHPSSNPEGVDDVLLSRATATS